MVKVILQTFVFLLLIFNSQAQDQYIYKKNFRGEIEIYGAKNGIQELSPLGTIKRNFRGEMVVEYKNNNQSRTSPYDKPINYDAYKIPLYDYTSEVNTLLSYLALQQNQLKVSTEETNASNNIYTTWLKKEEAKAANFTKNLISFYSKFEDKPSKLSDGWKNVIITSEALQATGNTLSVRYNIGYAKISDNKVVLYYEKDGTLPIFDGFDISRFVGGSLKSCKAIVKDDYNIKTLYFVDNMIDTAARSNKPKMASIRFNLKNPFQQAGVHMYKTGTSIDDPSFFVVDFKDTNPLSFRYRTYLGKYDYVVFEGTKRIKGSVELVEDKITIVDVNN